jgi:hypothetical protein
VRRAVEWEQGRSLSDSSADAIAGGWGIQERYPLPLPVTRLPCGYTAHYAGDAQYLASSPAKRGRWPSVSEVGGGSHR